MAEIITLPSNIISNIATVILPDKKTNNIVIDNVEQGKKIVICIHKDISKECIDLLSEYGKVLFFEDHYQNIEPNILYFDYLIIDLRKEVHRNYYKLTLYNNHNYYFVLYRYWFEGNNGIYYNNEITEFPSRQSAKKNYDKLLLLQNVYEPKWYVSFFRLCCNIG